MASDIKILRRCISCPDEFAIKDMSSRASYCPRCRNNTKQLFISKKHKRCRDDQKQAA